MSRVLIVSRTRMNHGNVCIGGHDVDRHFRAVRLLNRNGRHWSSDSPFRIGDLWEMRYRSIPSFTPPHVEDVRVEEYRKLQRVEKIDRLVQSRLKPWIGPPESLFDGTVHGTRAGTGYIPAAGPLPSCSTGYWLPDYQLVRRIIGDKVRFEIVNGKGVRRFSWVGMQDPPDRIEAGSLVRVSLSRLFSAATAPEGYYVQISGVIRHGPSAQAEFDTNGANAGLEAFGLPRVSLIQKLVNRLRSDV